MRRKIIMSLFIILIITISRYYIVNATDENSNIEISTKMDSDKNVTLNIQTNNVILVNGIIDYDSDILEYVEIEAKNNCDLEVNPNTLEFSATPKITNSSEKVTIITAKFKLKDVDNVLDTSIALTDIDIMKNDLTTSKIDELISTVTITEENTSDNQDENGSDIKEGQVEVNSNVESGDALQYTWQVQADEEENANGTDEDYYNGDSSNSTAGQYNATAQSTANKVNSTEEDNNNLAVENEAENIKENLADSGLPQTGMIAIPSIIIAVLVGISAFVYKKYKK